MVDSDTVIARRIRDIVAVATDDIDAVIVDVEDGVAYVEGVVGSVRQREAIISSVLQITDLKRLITCLAVERVLNANAFADYADGEFLAAPEALTYYSLS